MEQGEFNAFQPRWSGSSEAPHADAQFQEVQESIAAAVVSIHKIAEQSFSEPRDELSSAGQRLAESLSQLKASFDGFVSNHSATESTRPQSGFDETKLLASIEKWQRRYQELEGEYNRVESQLLNLEEEAEELSRENTRLQELHAQLLERVDNSIALIDSMTDHMEGEDEENRNYH